MAQMPLNKYIAHAGICSRRKAVELIQQKKVRVNNAYIMDPGFKVTDRDEVIVNGKKIVPEAQVYILLNKPKDCVSTVSDERGRRTVLDVIKGATNKRVYPVGRLDRNTTGLLLLTNDGALAQRLAHPKYQVPKRYHVLLDRVLAKKDIDAIKKGVTLSDGSIRVDAIEYILPSKKRVALTLHSGKYRVVRRLFESFGYTVVTLDRVRYGNLTKRGLVRGAWRMLEHKELDAIKK